MLISLMIKIKSLSLIMSEIAKHFPKRRAARERYKEILIISGLMIHCNSTIDEDIAWNRLHDNKQSFLFILA
jgi:hypothetical protein